MPGTRRFVRSAPAPGRVDRVRKGPRSGPVAGRRRAGRPPAELLRGARTGSVIALAGRELAAESLLDVLTGRAGAVVHPRGLRIEGARITGGLDWEWQHLGVPLALVDCDIEGPITLDHARIAGLSLIGCRLPGLSAEQMTCDSTLRLLDSTVDGTVDLRDVEVTGALLASGATVEGTVGGDPDRPGVRLAILADRIRLSGALVLGGGFGAHGVVRLTGARIGGDLLAHGARFRHPEGDAIEALDAQIGGNATFARGFSARGRVRLDRTRIAGDLDCDGGSFDTGTGSASLDGAILMNGADVGGQVHMRNGFSAVGGVQLRGARIAGQWNCSGGEFTGVGGRAAIRASDADILGSVYFRDGFRSFGRIRMVGTRIRGNFGCDGATMINPGEKALETLNLSVGGDLYLGRRPHLEILTVEGKVRPAGAVLTVEGEAGFVGARVAGSVWGGGAVLTNPGAVALTLADAEVGGSVVLGPGARVTGQTRVGGARIGGRLDLAGSTLSHPDGLALHARAVEVGSTVRLGGGFTCDGSVLLSSARITDDLSCDEGTFAGDVVAEGATVGGSFRWRRIGPGLRHLDLRRARVGELDDDGSGWPPPGELSATGFLYETLSAGAPRDPRARVAWLRLQPAFAPEPYQQLAAVYRSNGQVTEATTVAMAQQDDLVRRGDLRLPSRIWGRFLGRTIGHGYRPGRAAWTLLLLYAVTFVTVWLGARTDSFTQVGDIAPQPSVTSSRCGDAYPCLSVPAYALENITPILDLHQAQYWQPKSSSGPQTLLRDWLYVSTVIGYAGTTLLAAALSGLARSA
jgi:hypothetical protein